MQLSCLPVSFFDDIIQGRLSVARWAQIGQEIGLDAIDLSILFVPDRSPTAVSALRRDVASAGLPITMVTSYPDFTHPDAGQRRREFELAQEVVAVCAGLGAKYLRVTAGQAHPETPRAAGIDWAVEGLTRLLEATRGSGVTLVYENHAKPGAWQYTDFSTPPDIFLEIARQTGPAGLGINFDTANATAFADDPLAVLEPVIERVITVHAADTAARGRLEMVLLGTGLAPFPALFRRLKQAGWDGWICMEEGSNRGVEGVAAAARFVQETWEKA